MIKISDLKLKLDFNENDLKELCAKKLKIKSTEIGQTELVKKSVDARDKSNICFVCSVNVSLKVNEKKLLSRNKDKKISKAEWLEYQLPVCKDLSSRPVVIGFGPAGMFAALILAQCGQRPIVLERGQNVDERSKSLDVFWQSGKLNTESNIQFGEGGAGTFSDGKLTTGIKDLRIRKVLEEYVKAGAPQEILFEAKPHVGTDKLPDVVRKIRELIISLGAEVHFNTRVSDLVIKDGTLKGLVFENDKGKQTIGCEYAVLAIGHSARDTFEMLYSRDVLMQAKPFSVGARIEHSAEMINKAQYGKFYDNPNLGTADYKLSAHLENGSGVYTFCMCPGGYVTGAASEENMVVTNGMSNYKRDGVNSNSAVLVGVSPKDYGADTPLCGISYQREIESAAYRLGGGGYYAPAQRLEDFLGNRESKGFSEIKPTYQPGVVPANIRECLPDNVCESLEQGILRLDKRLKGFNDPNAVITAPETRSSSPVRIMRGEDMQSVSVRGLYPAGEGAGYAGGITSAAVDGIKCAEILLKSAK